MKNQISTKCINLICFKVLIHNFGYISSADNFNLNIGINK